MFEFTRHINRTARYVRLFLVLLVGALVAGAFAVAPSPAFSAGYSWPVKPFTREHPIRGNFGDPRTLFSAPPTIEGLLTGGGSFQFHFGVDVSAPDGAKVYPVVSGTVSRLDTVDHAVTVSCGDGRSFEYWHIGSAVRVGDHVTASRTVLGAIVRGAKHVHLTELRDDRPVNPLQAGHLTPYTDRQAPRIQSISIRSSVAALELPNFLRGSVDFVAEVTDRPNRPVPGIWRNMPVSPALITWRLESMTGKTALGPSVAVDFRVHQPQNSAFWSYYARGSFQNMSVFGKHYSYMQPGRYLYRLTRSPFDTTRLKDGVYDLVVTATDIRGNSTTESLRITVHNRPGWIGS